MTALLTHDATALAALVAAKDITPTELLDAALSASERLNPHLNAVVLIQEDVARRAIARGLPAGPFTGVPFLLKDLGCEAMDFPSHNGSRLFAGTRYPGNSAIYDRISATGVVTFGRTTSPEGGIGAATEAAVYGAPTRNPWNPDHTPGGSSGGAGAAVAAGIVPFAHGSDGGGSVRIPASNCGLFGFKPTRARLPDGPYVGEGWAGMAIDGFLTKSVRDTATMLDACMGADPGAPYAAPHMPVSHAAAITRPPKRLRIALCETTFTDTAIDPQVRAAVLDAAKLLESLGHHITPARPKGAFAYAATLPPTRYLQAVGQIHAFGRQMAAFFDDHDILLSATMAEPPARIGRFNHATEDYLSYRIGPQGIFAYSPFCAVFNASGQPAASLPLGMSAEGLPIGIHLAAPFGDDATLIALCAEIEQAAPWMHRRPPLAVA
ncbi:MAG: amidase family protein [Rhodobacteraceae bacterium]|nr:amidase family protein [Paracoccaceae bacterium]